MIVNGDCKREILFKKGVNLIVDGSVNIDTESGNSVGKTTVLRAIDFCFGAHLKYFYEDKEFGTDNSSVKNFFEHNNVVFKLEVDRPNKSSIILTREANIESGEACYVDEVNYSTVESYTSAIREAVYFSGQGKPSLRQILSRFMRHNPDRMSNALRTLFQTTSHSEYESLNLFLFHFGDSSVINEKQFVSKKIGALNKQLTNLKNLYKKSQLQQSLLVINRDIDALEKEKKEFKFNKSYENEFNEVKNVRADISRISLEISEIEMKLTMNKKALDKLENSKEDIDPGMIFSIYSEATSRLGELSKTFEDSLNFHNKMISKKMEFITSSLPTLENALEKANKELSTLLDRQSILLSKIEDTGSLADLEVIQFQLNELYEDKGKTDQALEELYSLENRIESEQTRLNELAGLLEKSESSFRSKLEKFNHFFAQYTKLLYDEEYVLSGELEGKHYQFQINPVKLFKQGGNYGEGTKKALITAFDFAYVSYLNEIGDRGFRFVAHDSIEAIHQNQVKSLFELGQSLEGQYIVSTLRKSVEFMGDQFLDENTVIKLDESNKFFKIP